MISERRPYKTRIINCVFNGCWNSTSHAASPRTGCRRLRWTLCATIQVGWKHNMQTIDLCDFSMPDAGCGRHLHGHGNVTSNLPVVRSRAVPKHSKPSLPAALGRTGGGGGAV